MVKKDIYVIPADNDKNRLQLGWTVKERTGSPVLLPDETKPAKDGLVEGMELLCPDLFGGHTKTTLKKTDAGWYGEGESNLYLLNWDEKYQEWVCSGSANKKALEKLK